MTSLSDTVNALLKSAKIGAGELRAGVAWQVQGGGAKLDMTVRVLRAPRVCKCCE